MTQPTLQPSRETYTTDLALWTAVLGPPISWFIHFQLVYSMVLHACFVGSSRSLHITSVIFFALTVACGILSWKLLGPTPAEHANNDSTETIPARPHFMAMMGIMSSGLFAIVLIAQWIATFMISPCWD